MGELVSPATVQAFYEALASRDPVRLAQCLSDDVEWHMAGPVDLFVFCGYRRGKAAVVDYIARLVPSMFAVKRFELEEIVIDGDTARADQQHHLGAEGYRPYPELSDAPCSWCSATARWCR